MASPEFRGQLNGQQQGLQFRLPTEAEWEFACRAGTATRFYYGDDATYAALPDNAWFDANAREICNDLYAAYSADAVTDPTGPTSGSSYVARGGSWMVAADTCRSASRLQIYASTKNLQTGFRLARTK